MKIIDSIILTLQNLFERIDWKLAKWTNYYIEIKGGIKSSSNDFFSLILSLIVGFSLINSVEKTVIILIVITVFFIICYVVNKKYSNGKNEISKRLENSIFQNRNVRIFITTLFMLLPIILLLILTNRLKF